MQMQINITQQFKSDAIIITEMEPGDGTLYRIIAIKDRDMPMIGLDAKGDHMSFRLMPSENIHGYSQIDYIAEKLGINLYDATVMIWFYLNEVKKQPTEWLKPSY
jgi:hypothetical protein